LKKLKNTLENLVLEKAKIEKGDKAKKNKGKGKAKLRVEGESALVNEYSAYEVDEFDDFM
jgi:translation initiation factor 3 subunit J